MKKINIAEILKDCPNGMELDCKICNGVKFIELDRNPNFPIVVRANNGYEFILTKYGQVHNIDDAKCVIFPKGKTTWEGFVPPCKFKDGNESFTIDNRLFQEVTFENSPQEVELKLVNEIVGIAESPLKTFPRINEFEVGASYRR